MSALIVGVIGCFWRIVLGGANKWAAWSQSVWWLRWCWDFGHEEPVLRRSVIMAVSPLLCIPLWLSPIPLWASAALTVVACVQWVWPGRDFAVWWSLAGAHGLWSAVGIGVLCVVFGWRWVNLWPVVSPVVAVISYEISKRTDNDRIGQGATGATVFGCLALAVW